MFTKRVTDKGLSLRVYKNSQNLLRQTTQFKKKSAPNRQVHSQKVVSDCGEICM